MFKKEEIKLIIYGIVASAYMVISYDIIQELVRNPIDWVVIWTKVPAGLISMVIGICVIYFLTWKRTSDQPKGNT